MVSNHSAVCSSPILSLLKKIANVIACLYVVSLATSMGGMEFFSSLLLLVLLIFFFVKRPALSSWQAPPFILPIGAFVLVVLLGIWLNPSALEHKFYDTGRLRFFLLYAVLYYYLHYLGSTKLWLRTLVLVALVIGLYSVFQHFIPLDLVRPEGKKIILYAIPTEKIGLLVIGTFNHHLTFSNIYLFYSCLFLSLGLYLIPPKSLFILLSSLLYLTCIWTQSRAGWFAVPLTVLILALGKGWKCILATLLLLGIGLGTFYYADAGFQQRFNRTFLQKNDFYNLGPRTRLWKANWQMFKDHPIIGVGYNNNERRASEYVNQLFPDVQDNFYGHAHSVILQLFSSTGILGVLAYLWLWWAILQHTFRSFRRFAPGTLERALALGLLAGFIGFHVQGITQWNFGDAEVLHNLMFFWAVAASLHRPTPATT